MTSCCLGCAFPSSSYTDIISHRRVVSERLWSLLCLLLPKHIFACQCLWVWYPCNFRERMGLGHPDMLMTWSKLYPISLIFANLFGSTAAMIACFDYWGIACRTLRTASREYAMHSTCSIRRPLILPKWSTFPSAKLTTGLAPSFNGLQRNYPLT